MPRGGAMYEAMLCDDDCRGYKYLEEVQVTCSSGTVRGRAIETCYGPRFVRFAGVPYAKPPVGPLRFLPPVPVARWENTIDATKLKPNCMSYQPLEDEILGSEDCLFCTIFTPEVSPQRPLPVMVWIGGYVFCFEDHRYLGAGWLTDERVVVVLVSCRLGPFGFLSIGQATAPGNCGLKDVVAALAWIRGNIAAFGGDPDNITIFGSSSGASMVHYMMLSPLATGLFHKAIIQGGSALHNWALSYHPLDAAKALARELNVATEDMHDAIEQLRALPAVEIMRGYASLAKKQDWKNSLCRFDAIFKPCVEDEFEGQRAFLTKYPYYLLKTGRFNRVPLIIGSNPHEGRIMKLFETPPLSQVFDKINVDLSALVPRELGLGDRSTGSKNLCSRLIQFYLRGDKLTVENSENFFNFMSDYYFNYYTNRCVKAHAHYPDHPIYYYNLETIYDCSLPEFLRGTNEAFGEVGFIFQLYSCSKYLSGEDDNIVRKKILKLWTNFAKYGNPTPDRNDKLLDVTWDPVTNPQHVDYLGIGLKLSMGRNPFHERMSFWDAVLDETLYWRVAAFFDNLSSANC